MPHTLTYGTESAANKAIGGIPIIHYFDFQSRGRGQAVRLMLIVSFSAMLHSNATRNLTPTRTPAPPIRTSGTRSLIACISPATINICRYTFAEWPEHKRSGKVAEMNPTTNIPIVEMPNGKILTQSYAILRHWGRLLGKYDGSSEEEKYWADAICDIVVDCTSLLMMVCV